MLVPIVALLVLFLPFELRINDNILRVIIFNIFEYFNYVSYINIG